MDGKRDGSCFVSDVGEISCRPRTQPRTDYPMTWLAFALLTVFAWGVYGVMLHTGQMAMGDPELGRYKAFLWVGIAYFVTAVIAPMVLIAAKGGDIRFWTYPAKGMTWSFIAGTVGAIGAFGVLLAFGAKGSPPVVMSIVFAGAPIINALVSLSLHPPKGGFGAVPIPFYLGIAMAAIGGCLVCLFKPGPGGPPKADSPAQVEAGQQ